MKIVGRLVISGILLGILTTVGCVGNGPHLFLEQEGGGTSSGTGEEDAPLSPGGGVGGSVSARGGEHYQTLHSVAPGVKGERRHSQNGKYISY